MRKTLNDVLYLLSSNSILKIIGIVSVIVFTRYLSKEELAFFPFYFVMGKFSIVIFGFGILQTLVREVPQLIKDNCLEIVHSLIYTSLIVIIPGALLFSVICFSLSEYISSFFFNSTEYAPYLELMSIGFFFSGINSAFNYIYWCLSRYQQESTRMVFVGLIQFALNIVFVLYWGLIGLIVSLVIGSLIHSIIFIYNLRDFIFKTSFKFYSFKKLIIDSLPFYLESYLLFFRAEGDQLFVASLLGPKALAIYFIAKKPYDVLSSFTISLDKVLTTSLAKCKNDIESFNKKINEIITLNAYVLFPLVLFAIGICPFAIKVIAGFGYEGAVIPSMILLLLLLVQISWKTTLAKSIFLLKSSTGKFKVTFIETFLLLGFMFLLGNIFHIMGVVVGRLIATISAGIIAYYIIKKDVSINIDYLSIAAITIYGIIMCLLLLTSQYFFTSYYILSLSFIISISIFLFLINRTVSAKFYKVINSISPFPVKDPFSFIFNI